MKDETQIDPTALTIYLATKFNNQEAFHALRKKFEAKGYQITVDWTKEDASKVSDAELPAYLDKCANQDLIGVGTADVFVLLAVPEMAGALVEFGFALRTPGMPILILDHDKPNRQPVIFYRLKDELLTLCNDEEELFAKLDVYAAAKREVIQALTLAIDTDGERFSGSN